MKRLVPGLMTVLLFVGFTTGQAAPRKVPVTKHYLISAPLQTLLRWRIRPQEVEGGVGLLTVSGKVLGQLQLAGLRVRIREIAEIPLPEPFLSPQEIDDEMKRLAKAYPDRVAVVDMNQRFKTALTVEGRSLKALRLRYPITDTAPRPIVVLDSLHHARELITPLITMDAARLLASSFNKDPEVTAWLKHYEIWIVPVVNPDGYQYVFTKEPYWRKNRRPNANGGVGVDLNRNYPYLWGVCGKNSADGKSEVYKGLAAASEPEIQTMVAMGNALRPHLYLSYHSYGDEIIRPYVCKKAAEEGLIQRVTERIANAAGYRFRKASSSGESFEHFYAEYGTLSYLVEVGKQFHPDVADIPGLITSARKTWRAFLARGMEAALGGVVQDAEGKPVKASLSLDEVVFQAGEIRESHQANGQFYWVLAPGNYTFRVRAPGFQPWSKKILVPSDQPLSLVVTLRREGAEPIAEPPGEKLRSEEPRRNEVQANGPDSKRESQPPEVSPEHNATPDVRRDRTPAQETGTTTDLGQRPGAGHCNCSSTNDPSRGLLWVGFWLLCLVVLVRRHRARLVTLGGNAGE